MRIVNALLALLLTSQVYAADTSSKPLPGYRVGLLGGGETGATDQVG